MDNHKLVFISRAIGSSWSFCHETGIVYRARKSDAERTEISGRQSTENRHWIEQKIQKPALQMARFIYHSNNIVFVGKRWRLRYYQWRGRNCFIIEDGYLVDKVFFGGNCFEFVTVQSKLQFSKRTSRKFSKYFFQIEGDKKNNKLSSCLSKFY